MKNRNAYIGKNIETLFKNSIGDHIDIINSIRHSCNIQGSFVTAINSGVHNEKVDVKMEFSCGRNIDANIKAYKGTVAYNQLTRTTLTNFCNQFGLNCFEYFQQFIIQKAKHTSSKLVPDSEQQKVLSIFVPIAKQLVEWSVSYKKAREILVLYERTDGIMHIYLMKEILKHLDYNVSFTKAGNIAIGNSIIIQRKGGNGIHTHGIKDKSDPTHPGNNIQVKLKVNVFVTEMAKYQLGQYNV